MAIPHNTVQDAERQRIEEETAAFLSGDGEINTLPDYDQPKIRDLPSDMKKIHSFCKIYLASNDKPPKPKRISAEFGIDAAQLKKYLLALEKLGLLVCNKHGVITGVK